VRRLPSLHRKRRSRPIEDSLGLRGLVLAIVVLALVAVIAQGAVSTAAAVVSVPLVAAGFVLSYLGRRRRNLAVKLVLAVSLMAALGSFLQRVRGAVSVDEARVALATLFIWVQVLHSFDLPRRRDLTFSLVASLVVMAEAASLSFGSGFALFLLPYISLVALYLYRTNRVDGQAAATPALVRVDRPASARTWRARTALIRSLALGTGVVVAATALVFISTPRLPGLVVAPPFSLTRRLPVAGFSGAVANPSLPSRAGGRVIPFSGLAYPGFGASVDLRARGHLSDQVVLKVRSPQAAFWRGQAYDTFDGTTWTASKTTTLPLFGGGGLPFDIPASAETSPGVPTSEVLQTFYVTVVQPNIVFGAYEPRKVYFPAPILRADPYGSVRSPILLDPGMVYSVVSEVPQTTPAMLRRAPAEWPADTMRQYTELPRDLPSRVIRLAHRITDGLPTIYDKVVAVQRWLRTHTRYSLDIPPDPPGVDAVDYFLFRRRRGFCEHVASSMAILLRSVGIPARFVVGFDTGIRNVLTGYYEVRESDAHSWVEVEYPSVGWVEYDPTHHVPPAAPGLGARFLAPQVFEAIGRFLARTVPAPVKRIASAVAKGAALLGRHIAKPWPGLTVLAFLLGVLAVTILRRRPHGLRGPPLTGAAVAFQSLCRTFEARGMSRPAHRTPSEHLNRLLADMQLTPEDRRDAALIVRAFERDRFSGLEPVADEVAESLRAAARLAGARRF
jgi:transglutaminase-like putative cysteine protease